MSNGFQFKQFFIAHDRCAMKVNTDGILLGSIANVQNTAQILDLGTGTGLVAIMLAQRSHAKITAIELEPNAYQQAVENCKNSAFSDRLQVLHLDVLALNLPQKFDLIVANPPYFTHSLNSRSAERDLARSAVQSHLDWLTVARDHLSENGHISFILPFELAERLIAQCHLLDLHCTAQWHICTKADKPPKRMVVTFSLHPCENTPQTLVVYDQQNRYTETFKRLTSDFYLNF